MLAIIKPYALRLITFRAKALLLTLLLAVDMFAQPMPKRLVPRQYAYSHKLSSSLRQ